MATWTVRRHAMRACALVGASWCVIHKPTNNEASVFVEQPGAPREDLPTYRKEEVAQHDGKQQERVWVTYRDGVYDITEFLQAHPGGQEKIGLAAGKAVDPFWKIYREPHQKQSTWDMLESMRIGNVDPRDRKDSSQAGEGEDNDPFANEPERHPALEMHSQKPCNAEAPATLLLDSFITPNELFFVRNHLPVPKVDLDTYRLLVEVPGKEPKPFTLEELMERFEKVEVVATLQCAGNRRVDLDKAKPAKGLPWRTAAVSTAQWTGARLRDVLLAAGLSEKEVDETIHHIQFEGMDSDPSGDCYGASIPVGKAMDPRGDVILAYRMNGESIPPDHGGPLRAIVPGVVGARNVKWVQRVVASDEESHSFWQRQDYKIFPPHVNWDNVSQHTAPSIQETPVQSAILQPSPGAKVSKWDDELELKGFALSGGGRSINRVDISVDGGKSWTQAELLPRPKASHNRDWAWTLWSATLKMEDVKKHVLPEEQANLGSSDGQLGDGANQVTVICRAVDSSGNVQPEHPESVWNLRGLLCNSWHQVEVVISDED